MDVPSLPLDRSKRGPKVSKEHRNTMAVLKEAGETTSDIAEIFGLNPRTVRKHLAKVSEDEKRAIRSILAARLLSKHARLAEKALDELLTRDLAERDEKGKHRISAVQLATVVGISSDKVSALAPAAGMADPQHGAPASNPLTGWFLTQEKLEKAMRGLPAKTKLRLRAAQEVEVSSEDDRGRSSTAVPATFSVEDEP